MKRLAGKVAIVTGAGRGIGEAIAMRFGAEGAIVVAANRRQEEGEAIVAAIRTAGGTADFVRTDIREPAECEHLVTEVINTHGRIDVLCNNAGVGLLRHGRRDVARRLRLPHGHQRARRVPALQAHHPRHGRTWERLHHQHGVRRELRRLSVRRGLLRVQGSAADADTAACARVRAEQRTGERNLPRLHRHAGTTALLRSAARTPRPRGPAATQPTHWAVWGGRKRSPPQRSSWPATRRRSSRGRRSSSMAAF